MTVIATNVVSDPFFPNGVAADFPFDFEVVDTDEVAASLNGVVLSKDLYVVTLNDDGTGKVTFYDAPAGDGVTDVLLLYTDPEFSQQTSLANQGPFFQKTIEKVLDRLAIRALWLRDRVNRSWRVPVGETISEFPSKTLRANKFPSFGPTGELIMSSGTGGGDAALRGDLGSTVADGGAGIIGYDGKTVAEAFTILEATARPAMRGLFSSGADQRAAILDFVAWANARGKVIEWGPIELALDAETALGEVRGIGVPSGSRWVFHPNTVLQAVPNSSDSSCILNFRDVSDIVIEGAGARLIGERAGHTDTGGQIGFGMGVRIQGCTDITIRDLHAEDCWGDGWYIGSTTPQPYCERVYLENISATNVRRNGLSLISAKGFRCVDGRFVDTNGIAPQWGIDIEPNSAAEFLEDIEFIRTFTSGNAGIGFGIYLNAMEGTANRVGIRIFDHFDDGSLVGFSPGRMVNIPGLIEYIGGKSVNADPAGILLRGKGANGPRVKIVRPVIIDWNRVGSSSSVLSAGILNYAANGDTGTYALGGLDIIEPDLRMASGSAVTSIASIDQRTTTPEPMRNVEIISPLNLVSLPITTQGVRRLVDPNRASSAALGNAPATIGLSGGAAHYITATLTTARTFTLAATHTVGREMDFMVGGADGNQARFAFPAGEVLFPDQPANYIYSSSKGARLKIRKAWNTLNYDAETVGFTVGATLTGGTSGATATIVRVSDAGTTGTLYLENVVGTFQDNETITGSGGGSATANGAVGAEWFVVDKGGSWATA